MRNPGCVSVILIGIVLAVTLRFLIWPAFAQHDHGNNKEWFDSLKNGNKTPCCSNADGATVADADWEVKDGHFRVYLHGEWYVVPDYAVLPGPNLDGRTIVWPIPMPGGIQIICFIPGMMT